MSTQAFKTKVRWLGSVADRHRIPETISVLVCVAMTLLGITLIVDADSYRTRPTFAVALGPDGWASPHVWGVLLIAPSVATGLALAARHRDVYWPMSALTGWLCAFSAALYCGSGDPGSVAGASITYTLLALITAVLALTYMREGRRSQ